MIDENRLDEMEGHIGASSVCVCVGAPSEGTELIRLARLGLWAEKHGVPAMRETHPRLEEALAALPKDPA